MGALDGLRGTKGVEEGKDNASRPHAGLYLGIDRLVQLSRSQRTKHRNKCDMARPSNATYKQVLWSYPMGRSSN